MRPSAQPGARVGRALRERDPHEAAGNGSRLGPVPDPDRAHRIVPGVDPGDRGGVLVGDVEIAAVRVERERGGPGGDVLEHVGAGVHLPDRGVLLDRQPQEPADHQRVVDEAAVELGPGDDRVGLRVDLPDLPRVLGDDPQRAVPVGHQRLPLGALREADGLDDPVGRGVDAGDAERVLAVGGPQRPGPEGQAVGEVLVGEVLVGQVDLGRQRPVLGVIAGDRGGLVVSDPQRSRGHGRRSRADAGDRDPGGHLPGLGVDPLGDAGRCDRWSTAAPSNP